MNRVSTELRKIEGAALFIVRTSDPAFQSVLPELAYPAYEDGFARPFATDAPDLDRIYANFDKHIEGLLEQYLRRVPVPWENALEELARRLERAGIDWFVSGSTALAVRGIEVAPRDIDFVPSDHAATVNALADSVIEPHLYDAGGNWIARWFGRAFLGARVEWAAEVYPKEHQWGAPNDIGPTAVSRLERVRWKGRSLLLSPLDIQLANCEHRGLEDRVAAIRRFNQRSAF